jgi:hypothetical protein
MRFKKMTVPDFKWLNLQKLSEYLVKLIFMFHTLHRFFFTVYGLGKEFYIIDGTGTLLKRLKRFKKTTRNTLAVLKNLLSWLDKNFNIKM